MLCLTIFYICCKAILNSFLKAMDESKLPYVSTQWMYGKKHIFFRYILHIMLLNCGSSTGSQFGLEICRFMRFIYNKDRVR